MNDIFIDDGDVLEQYGILRKSGRYPWGSGTDPYQRSSNFYAIVDGLRKDGLTDKQIAQAFTSTDPEDKPFTVKELKLTTTMARNQLRAGDRSRALILRQKDMSVSAIARKMGVNESSVRSLLDDTIAKRQSVLETTVDMLRGEVDDKKYIDIGKASEQRAGGISRDKLMTAVAVLEDEGYKRFWHNQETGVGKNKTTTMVLARSDATYPDLELDPTQIKLIGHFTENKGESFIKMKPPLSVSSKKVDVVYGPEGGTEADGLVELRRGVKELDMGNASYSQVRILVDGTHYIKGMAVISDDLPAGTDIRVHSVKSNTGNKLDVLKPVETIPGNPFGSAIKRQNTYEDAKGETKIGALNIINEEGDWAEWNKSLSSQMLSKQSHTLAKKQLDLFRDGKKAQLDGIKELTNPTLKKELLREFSEKVDADAVDLKALGLPNTTQKVLIPIPTLKESEIYSPAHKQGERVVLIRHPHGGIFEIPELVVNNRNPVAKKVMGVNPQDAVGINAKVAEQLSGADFDGDHVVVIPNPDGLVKHRRPVKALQEFEPREQYKQYDGMKVMRNTQTEMGSISNLITDMDIMGAPLAERVRAVKHSMVVIDAEKHKLNYRQSFIDHGIAQLKKEYQTGGASTVISRARADVRVRERNPRRVADGGPIDKKTGQKKWTDKPGYEVKDKATGEVLRVGYRTEKTTRMRETSDARTLMSSPTGTPIERVYADHANELKAMANDARLEMMRTPNGVRNKAAAQTYAPQVESLKHQLKVAQSNAPLERAAQRIAGAKVKALMEADPGMKPKRLKKVRTQELTNARALMSPKGKQGIDISPLEWEAIQAGAIAHTPLSEIFSHSSPKQIKEYATPRDTKALTGPTLSRARGMLANGYTQAEIAETLGVSVSTIQKLLKN